MAVDMFLKIDGIEGESLDDSHGGEIDVLNWTWGMTQTGTAHKGGGAGNGSVSVQDVVVSKHVDRSSPTLMKLCCSGKHFDKAVLTCRKAGGSPVEYVKLRLIKGIITEVSSGGTTGDDRLTETVRLNFEQFEYIYTPQDSKGAAGGEIPAQWNIAKNTDRLEE